MPRLDEHEATRLHTTRSAQPPNRRTCRALCLPRPAPLRPSKRCVVELSAAHQFSAGKEQGMSSAAPLAASRDLRRRPAAPFADVQDLRSISDRRQQAARPPARESSKPLERRRLRAPGRRDPGPGRDPAAERVDTVPRGAALLPSHRGASSGSASHLQLEGGEMRASNPGATCRSSFQTRVHPQSAHDVAKSSPSRCIPFQPHLNRKPGPLAREG